MQHDESELETAKFHTVIINNSSMKDDGKPRHLRHRENKNHDGDGGAENQKCQKNLLQPQKLQLVLFRKSCPARLQLEVERGGDTSPSSSSSSLRVVSPPKSSPQRRQRQQQQQGQQQLKKKKSKKKTSSPKKTMTEKRRPSVLAEEKEERQQPSKSSPSSSSNNNQKKHNPYQYHDKAWSVHNDSYFIQDVYYDSENEARPRKDSLDVLGSPAPFDDHPWYDLQYWKKRWSQNCCLFARENPSRIRSSPLKQQPCYDQRMYQPPLPPPPPHYNYQQLYHYNSVPHSHGMYQQYDHTANIAPRNYNAHHVVGQQMSPLTDPVYSSTPPPPLSLQDNTLYYQSRAAHWQEQQQQQQQQSPKYNNNIQYHFSRHYRMVSSDEVLSVLSDDSYVESASNSHAIPRNLWRSSSSQQQQIQQVHRQAEQTTNADNESATTTIYSHSNRNKPSIGLNAAINTNLHHHHHHHQQQQQQQQQPRGNKSTRRTSLSSLGNKPPAGPSRRPSLPLQTIASEALPSLPSPPSFGGTASTNTSTNNKKLLLVSQRGSLTRSFSEASGNTTASWHRRGGTAEFSFATDGADITDASFESSNASLFKPPPQPTKTVATRNSSLPLEIKIRINPLRPETRRQQVLTRHQSLHERRVSLHSFLVPQSTADQHRDDDDDCHDHHNHCSLWDCTPPRARQYQQQQSPATEDSTPDGYISPLEEEFLRTTTCTTTRPRAMTSPSAVTISSEDDGDKNDYFTIHKESSSSSTRRSSNPQDDNSLAGKSSENLWYAPKNEEGLAEGPLRSFEETSPFAKLKAPPAIPKGEAWMWQWLNGDDSHVRGEDNDADLASFGESSVQYHEGTSSQSRMTTQQTMLYLPASAHMEEAWKAQHPTLVPDSNITVSGWVAFGLDSTLQDKLLVSSGATLQRADIGYLVATNKWDKVWLSTSSSATASFDCVLDLNDCHVRVEHLSSQHGRAVVIRRNASGEMVGTLLPVSLPDKYSGVYVGDGDSAGDYALCFPKGDFLPDEQQYTAMHINFALDALIKANVASAF